MECRGATVDPNVSQPWESQGTRVEEAELASDLEDQGSTVNAPESLAASIAVHRSASTTQPRTLPELSIHAGQDPDSQDPAHQQQEIEDSGESGDIFNA